jgi:hypothetical protein
MRMYSYLGDLSLGLMSFLEESTLLGLFTSHMWTSHDLRLDIGFLRTFFLGGLPSP